MRRLITLLLLLLSLMQAGCTTLIEQRKNDQMRARQDVINMKDDMRTLSEQVNALEEAQAELNKRLAVLSKADADNMRVILKKVASMEVLIKALELAREKDNAVIVDELKRIAIEIKASAASGSVSGSGSGYEHVIKAGETLSEIAEAYDVTVQTIVGANDWLKSSSTVLRVGKKLFIPE